MTRPSAPLLKALPSNSIPGEPLLPACNEPSMMIGLVMTGRGDDKCIVEGPPPGSRRTTRFSSGESFASNNACRRVPGPESSVLVTGRSYGMTRTMKLQEFEFRQSSTAVPMTKFVPTGNNEPGAGEVNMAGFAVQLSVAVGSL